ncbi:hypothetical protein M911_10080 [Ectothiorhodospira haloalkaliphila]|uniref:Lysine-N-methylase n=1 Tax=Ectothiorhodospira haloalkaliphila TaxID=421628 RepID=W8LA76_9GAMM|nr:flagellin lysine-N-methylase [Ectothiorhodospira haloalkaliphila]AHK80710.1 hypothetical protein M911_10080 [Ectothiorhodospira haloalkaliphila]
MTKTVMPAYVQSFVCDGQRCPDNCCLGTWRIHVDEPHYRRLKKVTDPVVKPLVDKYVKRNRNRPNRNSFAKLLQDRGQNQCAFLSEDRLCGLQQRLGADYLHDVCMLYPRLTNEIIGHPLERSLSLSCPLAAELALLDPDSMTFVEVDLDLQGREMFHRALNPYAGRDKRPALAHALALRQFTIRVLKTRDLPLWKRLVILGIFFDKVQQRLDAGEVDRIPAEINQYTQMVVDNSLSQSLDGIVEDATLPMKLAKEVMTQKISSSKSRDLMTLFVQSLAGIGFNSDDSDEVNGQRYQQVCREAYEPFMASREYLLENYLVNHVFSNIFPMNRQTPMDSFAMMAVQYAVIKMLLVGQAGLQRDNFAESHVVNVVQKFVKGVEHSPQFLDRVHDQLAEKGLLSMGYMAILVRN